MNFLSLLSAVQRRWEADGGIKTSHIQLRCAVCGQNTHVLRKHFVCASYKVNLHTISVACDFHILILSLYIWCSLVSVCC